jgi:hypothetical protein
MIDGLTHEWQSKHGADFLAHCLLGDKCAHCICFSHRLEESALQMECICQGFYSVVPRAATVMLSPTELELLVCGHLTVDLEVQL